ncbi:hypothetical protein [Clostridium botulinum]|uniref:hypothetical protein n=1 Tax=Clostridium botulinum TaxID=1491 RepID=UPI001E553414|nr:hypothetical protein [Clostridium botulinum]MCD3252420.1 hypothetical protein [Clostridium botulinum C/D]MCD3277916.1 hypothetical protein [Clostridium botulinum C/D]MCD3282132.1 hypothetical protein [Clostridium botulinum C/D]MCD3355842.1 hypothetical protein [Clostridium botulinum C/D]
MEILNIKEYDLDYIMENYFNTDKEVMFLCDYETAWEILKYGEYEDEDFENYFSIDLDCQYPYYSVYKCGDSDFIIEFITNEDEELYDEYGANNILIQDCVLSEYGKEIIKRCFDYEDLIVIGDKIDLKSLKEYNSDKEQEDTYDKHYNRIKGFLEYDIEQRDLKEQKEILKATIQVANELKEELEISNKDGYYDIWNSIIKSELEMLDGDIENEKKLLEQIQKVVVDQLEILNKDKN